MRWSLFLDDERFPVMKNEYDDWMIARSIEDAFNLIADLGEPRRMSLDHDLGDNVPTGYDFIKRLVEAAMNNEFDLKVVKEFYVHSQNPVGAKNIQAYWDNALCHLKE